MRSALTSSFERCRIQINCNYFFYDINTSSCYLWYTGQHCGQLVSLCVYAEPFSTKKLGTNSISRARIKDLEGQGHFQKGHFRLRRALWLSKKAPRPSKKRHKGQKRKRAAYSRGGGGGDSDTFFFPTSKKNPPKKQKKKKARRQLSSASAHSVPLNAKRIAMPMACAVICIGMKLRR